GHGGRRAVMKRTSFLACAIALVVVLPERFVDRTSASATGQEERPGLVGSWRVVKPAKSEVDRLGFGEGERTIFYWSIGNKVYDYRADANVNPGRIDVLDGEQAKCLGIFEFIRLNGDTLRICLGPWQGERPVRFAPDGNKAALLELVRATE